MFKPKTSYDAETDTRRIEMADTPAVDNEEVAEDVIVGFDKDNKVVSIEILNGVWALLSPVIKNKKSNEPPSSRSSRKGSIDA